MARPRIDIEEGRRMIREGWTSASIAGHFGVSLSAVKQFRFRHQDAPVEAAPPAPQPMCPIDAAILRSAGFYATLAEAQRRWHRLRAGAGSGARA